MTARLLGDKDLHIIRAYDKRPPAVQEEQLEEVGCPLSLRPLSPAPRPFTQLCRLLWVSVYAPPVAWASRLENHDNEPRCVQNGAALVDALTTVLRNVTKEETVQYVLALLDDIVTSASLQRVVTKHLILRAE